MKEKGACPRLEAASVSRRLLSGSVDDIPNGCSCINRHSINRSVRELTGSVEEQEHIQRLELDLELDRHSINEWLSRQLAHQQNWERLGCEHYCACLRR